MDILIFGQQNWDVCWTAKQHLATGLAGRGHRVVYVDPDPAPPGLAEIGRNLWVSRDRPWPGIGWRANQQRRRGALAWRMRRIGFTAPVSLALHPSALGRLGRHGIVYYAVDDYGQYGGMTEAARAQVYRQETAMLAQADVRIGVSPYLVDRFRDQAGQAHLLENGADVEHFAPHRLARMRPHPAMPRGGGPVLGFFGQIDDRLDQELVLALARRRPGWRLVLAGRAKGIDAGALAAQGNIHLLGYQDYAALPAMARDVDLWLLPYRQTNLTHACNPLKVYEYLATGKPVVATPLDGLVRCREAVALALGADAWIAAIESGLADPAGGAPARLALAQRNAWPARVAELEGHLQAARELAFGDRAEARRMAASRAPRASPLPAGVNEYGLPAPGAALGLHRPLLLAARALGAVRRLRRLGRGMPPRPRFLWTRRANLGDVIVTEPALRALRAAFPEAHIAVGTGPRDGGRALLERMPEVDEVIPGFIWAGQGHRAELFQVWRMWRKRFDVVLQSGGALYEPEGAFAAAPRMVSLYDGHPLGAIGGHAVPKEFHLHEAANALRLAELAAGRALEAPGPPRLPPLDPPEPAGALAGLAAGELLVVHPGASKPTRRWPPAHFAACLMQVLAARPRLRVVLTGSVAEGELAQAIHAAIPTALAQRVLDRTGRTSLAELAALLRRADALLCNDTGILHLGRAIGTPLVALLGPENARLWGPHPTGIAPAAALRVEVPCAPCALRSCAAHWCMRLLPPREVAERLLDMLGGAAGRDGQTQAQLDTRWMGWQALAQAGEAVPLYSLVTVPEGEAAGEVDAAVAAAEAQTYPAIELIVVRPAGAPPLADGREARRRDALPIRQLVATGGRDAMLAAGMASAGGTLVRDAIDCRRWRAGLLAADMAAAMRAPEVACFRDGAPATAPVVAGGVIARGLAGLALRPGEWRGR